MPTAEDGSMGEAGLPRAALGFQEQEEVVGIEVMGIPTTHARHANLVFPGPLEAGGKRNKSRPAV